MIPKSLLTVFLSLQSLERPPQDTQSQYDTNAIGNTEYPLQVNQEPVVFSQGDNIGAKAQTTYPFDYLASGDWNNDLVIEGVQITNNATSRLWSLPDAFPDLKPSHGGKKAWGPYPQGKNFTLRFDKEYINIVRTFGWLVNGRLSAGSYTTALRSNGKWVAGGSGSWGNDQWSTWSSTSYACDQVDITVTEGIETGLLLLDFLAYEAK